MTAILVPLQLLTVGGPWQFHGLDGQMGVLEEEDPMISDIGEFPLAQLFQDDNDVFASQVGDLQLE